MFPFIFIFIVIVRSKLLFYYENNRGKGKKKGNDILHFVQTTLQGKNFLPNYFESSHIPYILKRKSHDQSYYDMWLELRKKNQLKKHNGKNRTVRQLFKSSIAKFLLRSLIFLHWLNPKFSLTTITTFKVNHIICVTPKSCNDFKLFTFYIFQSTNLFLFIFSLFFFTTSSSSINYFWILSIVKNRFKFIATLYPGSIGFPPVAVLNSSKTKIKSKHSKWGNNKYIWFYYINDFWGRFSFLFFNKQKRLTKLQKRNWLFTNLLFFSNRLFLRPRENRFDCIQNITP